MIIRIRMKQLTLATMLLTFFVIPSGFSQEIAILKYGGGGDWYSNPTAVPNLIKFCNQNLRTVLKPQPKTVEAGSTEIFQYPFIHMTGHGNVFFTDQEVQNIRKYLLSGGFIHIDDNYGMAPYLRKELKKIFPDKSLTELPANHPIFKQRYNFPAGLPKIHEHDGKRPQAFGIFEDNRLLLLFTFESDLGDGWENQEVHNDPPEKRLEALQMGANIVQYVFEN